MQSRHSLPVPPCQETPSLNYINHQSMGEKKILTKWIIIQIFTPIKNQFIKQI